MSKQTTEDSRNMTYFMGSILVIYVLISNIDHFFYDVPGPWAEYFMPIWCSVMFGVIFGISIIHGWPKEVSSEFLEPILSHDEE
jgi:hypothetical protein